MFIDGTVVRDSGAGLGVNASVNTTVRASNSRFVRNAGHGIAIANIKAFDGSWLVIQDNGGSGVQVAEDQINPRTVMATLTDSVISGNVGSGVHGEAAGVGDGVHIAASRVTSSGNGAGFSALSDSNMATVTLVVTDSAAIGNQFAGLGAIGAGMTAVVTRSTLARNGTSDLSQSNSSVLRTSGNNTLTGRGAADISGTLTANPLK